MAEFLDLTGKEYGRLTVIKLSEKRKSGKRFRFYWLCSCECGNEKKVRTDGLTSGNIRSCGCLRNEQAVKNVKGNHKHKLSHTKLWYTYYGMLDRCYDKSDERYNDYGGRGINICDDWKNNFESFATWAIENGYNDTLTIDRIDNNGDYSPNNCKWSTIQEQSRNRRSNLMIMLNGELMTLMELSETMNIPYKTAYSRYREHCVKRKDLDKHANSVVNIQMAKG